MKSHTAERAPWFQGQRLGRSFENQAEDSAVITWDSPRGHPVLALKVGFKGRSVVLEEGLGTTGSLGCQQRIEWTSSPGGGSQLSR